MAPVGASENYIAVASCLENSGTGFTKHNYSSETHVSCIARLLLFTDPHILGVSMFFFLTYGNYDKYSNYSTFINVTYFNFSLQCYFVKVSDVFTVYSSSLDKLMIDSYSKFSPCDCRYLLLLQFGSTLY